MAIAAVVAAPAAAVFGVTLVLLLGLAIMINFVVAVIAAAVDGLFISADLGVAADVAVAVSSCCRWRC